MLMSVQLRSATDDAIIYQPFQSPKPDTRDTTLHFLKVSTPRFAKNSTSPGYDADDEKTREPVRAISDCSGYSTVFLPGESPAFILKSASSPPRMLNIRGGTIQSLMGLSTSKCPKGFAYLDQKVSVRATLFSLHLLSIVGICHLRTAAGRLSLPYGLGYP